MTTTARSPQPNSISEGEFGFRFWCLVPLTGLAAGFAAGLLMRLLRLVQELAWHEGSAGFLAAVSETSSGYRVLVLAGAGVLVAGGGWCLRRLGGPSKPHSGELTAAIWFRDGRLPFWSSLARAAFSIVVVGLGASLGREAAPKQAGAAFGSLFARTLKLSSSHTRILAAIGAGAGIGAVYQVPLGGALFAIEVLIGSLALPLIAPAILASAAANAAIWLLLPDRPTYDIPFDNPSWSLMAFAIAVGPLAGLMASGYVWLIGFADARRPTGAGAIAAPVLVLTLLGCAAVPLPQLLGNGKDVVELAFTGKLAWPILAALVVAKPLATAACIGCGAPGGLFTPTLTFGAVLGGLAGSVWSLAWPGTPSGAFAIVGATAVLAAATQGPASAIVMVLELTRRLDTLMVPVLLAVGGAMLVVRFLEPLSLYACRIHEAQGPESGTPAISIATPYLDLVRMLPPDGGRLRAVDETGRPVGDIEAERVRRPTEAEKPLVAASAGDFVDTKHGTR